MRICREWLNKWNTEKTCVFYSQPLAYDGNSKERSLCGVDGLWRVTLKFGGSPWVASGVATGPGGNVD